MNSDKSDISLNSLEGLHYTNKSTLHRGNSFLFDLCSSRTASAPSHHCPGVTLQPCSWTHPSAFFIISPVFNSCHFIISSLQPTLFSGLKPHLFVWSDLQQAPRWFAAPSWSRSPQTMQDSAPQTNSYRQLSLSSSSCCSNGTAYGFGLLKGQRLLTKQPLPSVCAVMGAWLLEPEEDGQQAVQFWAGFLLLRFAGLWGRDWALQPLPCLVPVQQMGL